MPSSPDLAAALRERIRREGFITVADYMDAVAAAYYARGDVFGQDGDFITAPEISQTFGEIIGLWCAVTWQKMGKPDPLYLIECGPGRGTLMADALRAAKGVAGFAAAVQIHLVERSPALRNLQREKLKDWAIRWAEDIADLPPGPSIVIANEFLDALPIRQFQRTPDGWAERVIELGPHDDFVFNTRALGDAPVPIALAATAEIGAMFETSNVVAAFVTKASQRIASHGGAALLIDYGHTAQALGDTLQAVKQHTYHNVLEAPGSADITAHVDFTAVAAMARKFGATVHGPVEQGTWLRQLGIGVRQVQLAKGKPVDVAQRIEQGVRRLTEPHGMGVLFKVMAIANPKLPSLDGFAKD
ncbi:MAG: class I SAM-dependent methyltransferase [Rhodospirillaceae bacterium]|nr:class I SAM-dependent methyltransferase [Rhodospirillaceae bacterium]